MTKHLLFVGLLATSATRLEAQDGPQFPQMPTGWQSHPCMQHPVIQYQFSIYWWIPNARTSGGSGQLRVRYKPTHSIVNIDPNQNYIATLSSDDVEVTELHNDMGKWRMKNEVYKTYWRGHCIILPPYTEPGPHAIVIFDAWARPEQYEPPRRVDQPPRYSKWVARGLQDRRDVRVGLSSVVP
jgi:hypothetical protein